jgi:Na+/H+ antiporter NhaD/arsenite permease-like protein
MWLKGVAPTAVLHAYIASAAAFLVFAPLAARAQQKHQPILRHDRPGHPIQWRRVLIVAIVLVSAIAANVAANARPAAGQLAPWLGIAVWVALVVTAAIASPEWKVMRRAFRGAVFLVALVASASLMPAKALPEASWATAFSLGFLSSVFDNIPLTALALQQGGYDWGVLAYAVGFGGSMIWFGSSAGVAVTTLYPEARSVTRWLRQGWYVPLAYVIGFLVLLLTVGWTPEALPSQP